MVIIKRIILMIQFFTTIPVRKRLDVQAKDFGKGLVFAPFVGLTLGYIIYGIFYLSAELFTIEIAPVFIFIVYILLTGGLHLDGLGDTFDGLFSGKPKDRIIEIMHDSRLGTNALLAVLSVVLLNTFFFFQFKNPDNVYMVIVLFPVSGRIGSLIGCSISRYAGEKGLGKSFVDYCNVGDGIIGCILTAIIVYLIFGIPGIVLIGLSIVTALILTLLFRIKLNGVTGDILGAICELNQMLFLLIAYKILTIF